MSHSRPSPYPVQTLTERAPRELEYSILARSTQRLAQIGSDPMASLAARLGALDENERIWSLLAVDVANEGNGLPRDLRAKLFYLYEFIARHSQSLRNGSSSSWGVLIDINTAVMRGLRGQVPDLGHAA